MVDMRVWGSPVRTGMPAADAAYAVEFAVALKAEASAFSDISSDDLIVLLMYRAKAQRRKERRVVLQPRRSACAL